VVAVVVGVIKAQPLAAAAVVPVCNGYSSYRICLALLQ
jgi:hypothetical protein